MKKNSYFDMPGVNSSILGWLLPESGGSVEMFKYFMANPPKELNGSAIDIGQALHKFIEAPDKYNHVVLDVPGPQLKAVIDLLVDDEDVHALDYMEPLPIIKALNTVNYQTGWKTETRVKKVIEEGATYFTVKRKEDEFTALLSPEDALTVEICMSVLKSKSDRIFAPELFYPEGTKIQGEVVLLFKHLGVDCKVLIDRLIINEKQRWVQVEDLKTTATLLPHFFGYHIPTPGGKFESVEGEMFKRQIHRQLGFYTMALKNRSEFIGYEIRTPWILALETIAPYRYDEVAIGEDRIKLGEERCEHALKLIQEHDLLSFTI